MQPYDVLYLRSRKLLCLNMFGPRNEHDCLCSINVTGMPGQITEHRSDADELLDLGRINIRTIDFALTNSSGHPVNLRGTPKEFQVNRQS